MGEPHAHGRWRRWVLVVAGGRDDPRHLGQRVVGHVAGEVVRVHRRERPLVESGRRVHVLVEVQQDVVGDGHGHAAGGLVGRFRRVVDLPRHPGLLQGLGHGGPAGAALGGPRRIGEDHRSARLAVGIEGPRQGVEPVRVGRAHDRAVVAVADGEGVGQGVVEVEVLAGVVAHGEHAVLRPLPVGLHVGGHEAVHLPAVPTLVLGVPLVREVEGALGLGGGRVEMEGEQGRGRASGPGLGEQARRAGPGVVEAADTLVGAEVVVERPVLLHEEHDVLHRSEIRTGRLYRRRLLRRRSAAGGEQHRDPPGHPGSQNFRAESVNSAGSPPWGGHRRGGMAFRSGKISRPYG